MISSQDFQNAYIHFYKEMRNYIWDMHVVEKLAELEIAIYDAFADMKKVRNAFYALDKEIKEVYSDDEAFKTSVNELRELIEKDDDQYLKLYQVTEVEPAHEDSEEINQSIGDDSNDTDEELRGRNNRSEISNQ